MHFSKSVRIGLILVIVIAALTIVWSFVTRQQGRTRLPDNGILSPQISRLSTQFEYVERRRGRTVFKVFAETSTETVNRIHTLKNLDVVYYNEAGEAAETISGREAVYRIDEKRIDFSGDTRIILADATHVFSDRVELDLAQERVTIPEAFRFQRDQVNGTGEGLIYEIPRKSIRVDRGLRLTIPTQSGEAHAGASQAVYRLSIPVVELTGDASVSRGQMLIGGDQIILFLTESNQIQKLIASGDSQLQSESVQFSGRRIDVFWRPETGELQHFAVRGDSSHRAFYRDDFRGRDSRLEADQITVVPGEEEGEAGDVALKRFKADGNVHFHSPSMGIEHARSEAMSGEFWEGGARLRNLDLSKNVSVLRIRPDTGGSVQEEISCTFLRLRFGSDEVLEHASARGNVDVNVRFPEGHRHLSARQFVEVDYRGGLPLRLLATGNCRLESVAPDEQTDLRASTIEARYQDGLLENVLAEGGVRLQSIAQQDIRHTASRRLTAVYRQGEMVKAHQSGGFHYWEGDPPSLKLSADEAGFDPATGQVSVQGSRPPVLELLDNEGTPVRTLANRIELNRRTGVVAALGQVRTVVPGSEGSTVITSERMKADPETGWIEYAGNPRITQPSSSITGSRVRYNRSREEMIVEERVQSVMTHGNAEGARLYSIDAERLVYERSKERVLYERNVQIKTEGLTVKAPFVELVFEAADSKELSHLIAWGGVHMVGRDREANGDRAVHYPSEDKVVLTGTPAEVIEPTKAKATGRRLTFFLNEERLLIEDNPGPAQ